MKKRFLLTVLLSTALIAPTNSASADTQSDYQLAVQQYQIALANWKLAKRAEQDNFKTDLANWIAEVKAADLMRKEIASKFKSDVDAITARTIAAITAAITAKDKKAASAAGKAELDLAILERKAALAAVVKPGRKPFKPKLSPAPTPPAKPAKAAKPAKPRKKAAEKKSSDQ
jgi:hypothetical protein